MTFSSMSSATRILQVAGITTMGRKLRREQVRLFARSVPVAGTDIESEFAKVHQMAKTIDLQN